MEVSDGQPQQSSPRASSREGNYRFKDLFIRTKDIQTSREFAQSLEASKTLDINATSLVDGESPQMKSIQLSQIQISAQIKKRIEEPHSRQQIGPKVSHVTERGDPLVEADAQSIGTSKFNMLSQRQNYLTLRQTNRLPTFKQQMNRDIFDAGVAQLPPAPNTIDYQSPVRSPNVAGSGLGETSKPVSIIELNYDGRLSNISQLVPQSQFFKGKNSPSQNTLPTLKKDTSGASNLLEGFQATSLTNKLNTIKQLMNSTAQTRLEKNLTQLNNMQGLGLGVTATKRGFLLAQSYDSQFHSQRQVQQYNPRYKHSRYHRSPSGNRQNWGQPATLHPRHNPQSFQQNHVIESMQPAHQYAKSKQWQYTQSKMPQIPSNSVSPFHKSSNLSPAPEANQTILDNLNTLKNFNTTLNIINAAVKKSPTKKESPRRAYQEVVVSNQNSSNNVVPQDNQAHLSQAPSSQLLSESNMQLMQQYTSGGAATVGYINKDSKQIQSQTQLVQSGGSSPHKAKQIEEVDLKDMQGAKQIILKQKLLKMQNDLIQSQSEQFVTDSLMPFVSNSQIQTQIQEKKKEFTHLSDLHIQVDHEVQISDGAVPVDDEEAIALAQQVQTPQRSILNYDKKSPSLLPSSRRKRQEKALDSTLTTGPRNSNEKQKALAQTHSDEDMVNYDLKTDLLRRKKKSTNENNPETSLSLNFEDSQRDMYIRNITINNKDINLGATKKSNSKFNSKARGHQTQKVKEIKFPDDSKKKLKKSPKKRNFNQSLCITKFNFPPISPTTLGLSNSNPAETSISPKASGAFQTLAAENSRTAVGFIKQQPFNTLMKDSSSRNGAQFRKFQQAYIKKQAEILGVDTNTMRLSVSQLASLSPSQRYRSTKLVSPKPMDPEAIEEANVTKAMQLESTFSTRKLAAVKFTNTVAPRRDQKPTMMKLPEIGGRKRDPRTSPGGNQSSQESKSNLPPEMKQQMREMIYFSDLDLMTVKVLEPTSSSPSKAQIQQLQKKTSHDKISKLSKGSNFEERAAQALASYVLKQNMEEPPSKDKSGKRSRRGDLSNSAEKIASQLGSSVMIKMKPSALNIQRQIQESASHDGTEEPSQQEIERESKQSKQRKDKKHPQQPTQPVQLKLKLPETFQSKSSSKNDEYRDQKDNTAGHRVVDPGQLHNRGFEIGQEGRSQLRINETSPTKGVKREDIIIKKPTHPLVNGMDTEHEDSSKNSLSRRASDALNHPIESATNSQDEGQSHPKVIKRRRKQFNRSLKEGSINEMLPSQPKSREVKLESKKATQSFNDDLANIKSQLSRHVPAPQKKHTYIPSSIESKEKPDFIKSSEERSPRFQPSSIIYVDSNHPSEAALRTTSYEPKKTFKKSQLRVSINQVHTQMNPHKQQAKKKQALNPKLIGLCIDPSINKTTKSLKLAGGSLLRKGKPILSPRKDHAQAASTSKDDLTAEKTRQNQWILDQEKLPFPSASQLKKLQELSSQSYLTLIEQKHSQDESKPHKHLLILRHSSSTPSRDGPRGTKDQTGLASHILSMDRLNNTQQPMTQQEDVRPDHREKMKMTGGNATAMGSTPSRQKSSNFLGDASIYQDHTQTQISLNFEQFNNEIRQQSQSFELNNNLNSTQQPGFMFTQPQIKVKKGPESQIHLFEGITNPLTNTEVTPFLVQKTSPHFAPKEVREDENDFTYQEFILSQIRAMGDKIGLPGTKKPDPSPVRSQRVSKMEQYSSPSKANGLSEMKQNQSRIQSIVKKQLGLQRGESEHSKSYSRKETGRSPLQKNESFFYLDRLMPTPVENGSGAQTGMINSTAYSKVSDAEERFESYPLPPEVSMNKKKQITKYYTKIAKILKKDSNAKFQFTEHDDAEQDNRSSGKKDLEIVSSTLGLIQLSLQSKKRAIVFDQNNLGERYFGDTINGYPEDEKDDDEEEIGRFRNKRVTEVPEVSEAKEGKTTKENGTLKKPEKLIIKKNDNDSLDRGEQDTAMLKKGHDPGAIPDPQKQESAPISPWQ